MNKGFSLIEIIISVAIVVMVTTGIVSALHAYAEVSEKSGDTVQAILLLDEGVEALRFLRDKGWSEYIEVLEFDTEYYLVWDADTEEYVLETDPIHVQGRFRRVVVVESVARDDEDELSDTGVIDNFTRKVSIAVYKDVLSEPLSYRELLLHSIYE